jgi:hypothetical protein
MVVPRRPNQNIGEAIPVHIAGRSDRLTKIRVRLVRLNNQIRSIWETSFGSMKNINSPLVIGGVGVRIIIVRGADNNVREPVTIYITSARDCVTKVRFSFVGLKSP